MFFGYVIHDPVKYNPWLHCHEVPVGINEWGEIEYGIHCIMETITVGEYKTEVFNIHTRYSE